MPRDTLATYYQLIKPFDVFNVDYPFYNQFDISSTSFNLRFIRATEGIYRFDGQLIYCELEDIRLSWSPVNATGFDIDGQAHPQMNPYEGDFYNMVTKAMEFEYNKRIQARNRVLD